MKSLFFPFLLLYVFALACNQNSLLEKAEKLARGENPFLEYPDGPPMLNRNGLVGWWSLNGDYSNKVAVDVITTAAGSPALNNFDRFNGNGAVSLADQNVKIQLPSGLIGTPFSLSFWLQLTGTDQNSVCYILEKHNGGSPITGYRLAVDTNQDLLYLETGDGNITNTLNVSLVSEGGIALGGWYYVTIQINNSNFVYFRVQKHGSFSAFLNSGNQIYSDAGLHIFTGPVDGSCVSGGAALFDDIVYYNRELSEQEIFNNFLTMEQ